jgi:hypothetical protein
MPYYLTRLDAYWAGTTAMSWFGISWKAWRAPASAVHINA